MFGVIASSRLLRSFLVELNAVDPAINLGVRLLLAAAALAAAWLPARRAAWVDPIMILRAE